MADPKHALVLHMTGSGEPVVFALSDEVARELAPKLSELLSAAKVDTVSLADGASVAVNFAHVVTAHLDELPPNARVYGTVARKHGFAIS